MICGGLRDELGLQNSVQFIGFVNDPADFLSNLDMFLLSSISEGFSIATIQAMAAGLPSIVTRSGGPQEIITHGQTGWMVEAGDPAAIAKAILKLAADPELCAQLAMNGRLHVAETFDMKAMLAAYEDIYDRL